jgi:hypothetical protein
MPRPRRVLALSVLCLLSISVPALAQTPLPPAAEPQLTEVPPAPEPGVPRPRDVTVHFDANRAEVYLMLPKYKRSSSRQRSDGDLSQYEYVCTAPCDVHLLEGTRELALCFEGDDPLNVDLPAPLTGGSTLKGTYESHNSIRAAGVGLIVGGVVLGSLVAFTGAFMLKQDTAVAVTLIAGGSTFGVGGVVVGTLLLLKKDRATIEVVPQAPTAALRWPGFASERPLAPGHGEGFALRLSF